MPSFNTFANRFAKKETKRFKGRVIESFEGVKNAEELNTFLLASCMIRRRKDDVLRDLPPKLRCRMRLDPEKCDVRKKKLVKDKINLLFKSQKNGNGNGCLDDLLLNENFDGVNSLDQEIAQQFGGSEKNADNTPSISEIFQLTAECKVEPVLEHIEYLLVEQPELKFLVFAHHKVMLDALEERVKYWKNLGSYIRIDGSTKQIDRPAFVKRYQEEKSCRVAILSITACGQGLTLTAASAVVFAELYWVPGALQQAEDRAHRIGQTAKMVNIYYLTCPGTLDDRVYDMVEKKAKDCASMLDGQRRGMQVFHKTRQATIVTTADPKLAAEAAMISAVNRSTAGAAAGDTGAGTRGNNVSAGEPVRLECQNPLGGSSSSSSSSSSSRNFAVGGSAATAFTSAQGPPVVVGHQSGGVKRDHTEVASSPGPAAQNGAGFSSSSSSSSSAFVGTKKLKPSTKAQEDVDMIGYGSAGNVERNVNNMMTADDGVIVLSDSSEHGGSPHRPHRNNQPLVVGAAGEEHKNDNSGQKGRANRPSVLPIEPLPHFRIYSTQEFVSQPSQSYSPQKSRLGSQDDDFYAPPFSPSFPSQELASRFSLDGGGAQSDYDFGSKQQENIFAGSSAVAQQNSISDMKPPPLRKKSLDVTTGGASVEHQRQAAQENPMSAAPDNFVPIAAPPAPRVEQPASYTRKREAVKQQSAAKAPSSTSQFASSFAQFGAKTQNGASGSFNNGFGFPALSSGTAPGASGSANANGASFGVLQQAPTPGNGIFATSLTAAATTPAVPLQTTTKSSDGTK
ncbi:unnamed protein product, partial [Amoebophrya sp. A120]|eukprot:GSA120T00012768001.1